MLTSSSQTAELHAKYSTATEHKHLKQTTAVVGVMVNQRIVTTAVTSTTQQQIVRVLLYHGHNGHLSLCYQRQTHAVSILKKAGSTVMEYFEWDLPEALSYGGAELLNYSENIRYFF
jgi:hypothetical protein